MNHLLIGREELPANIKLKGALLRLGIQQRELAKATGIPEARISMNITGKYRFKKTDRQKICIALGMREDELFEKGE